MDVREQSVASIYKFEVVAAFLEIVEFLSRLDGKVELSSSALEFHLAKLKVK